MHSFPYGSNGRADAPGRENDSLVGRFAEEHYDKVYRYCARRLPSKEDAQDVTQEVFLRLVRSDALYAEHGKPLRISTPARAMSVPTSTEVRDRLVPWTRTMCRQFLTCGMQTWTDG